MSMPQNGRYAFSTLTYCSVALLHFRTCLYVFLSQGQFSSIICLRASKLFHGAVDDAQSFFNLFLGDDKWRRKTDNVLVRRFGLEAVSTNWAPW